MKKASVKLVGVISDLSQKCIRADQLSAYCLRADLSDNYDFKWEEVEQCDLPVIFSLRSKCEGGKYDDTLKKRHDLLIWASHYFDYIELEGERDLTFEMLQVIPASKRIISWHGQTTLDGLKFKLDLFTKVPAAYYQLINHAETSGEELAPLILLKQYSKGNLITYASGPIGLWTQVVAANMGAPVIYGQMHDSGNLEDLLRVDQLIDDYDFPNTRPFRDIYGIVGNPVFKSLSPKLHNRCYKQLGIQGLYVPFHIESYLDFWKMTISKNIEKKLGFRLRGFTTVSPFKEEAFNNSDLILNVDCERSMACNLLYEKNGGWIGDTTDGYGVRKGIEGIDLWNKNVAIIGCGGAGRTIAAYLDRQGYTVTIYNRSSDRSIMAAQHLKLKYEPLSDFNASGYGLIINATPIGKNSDEIPFDPMYCDKNTVVIDMAYSASKTTRLVELANIIGLTTIDGRQMLVNQVREQFKRMTQSDMPLELAEDCAQINLLRYNKEDIGN